MAKKQEKHEGLSLKALVDSGAHFGHQRSRWNPKMKRFILDERNGIHIIDLAKTMQQIRKAKQVVEKLSSEKTPILFVGTKKQAKAIVKDIAEQSGEYYVCERWLGGTLTNLKTIRQSVKTLERIEKRLATGGEGLTKKEKSLLFKEQIKLERNLSGIRALRKIPGLLVVVDPDQEHIAVKEAKTLKIPVLALVDTNCDPDPIDHIIACNDDSLKCIKLILSELAKAVMEKKKELNIPLMKGEQSSKPSKQSEAEAKELVEVAEEGEENYES